MRHIDIKIEFDDEDSDDVFILHLQMKTMRLFHFES